MSLNPDFESGGSVDDLVAEGVLHPQTAKVFRVKESRLDTGLGKPIRFHRHQRQAIEAARTGRSYVLTTGTGSGKSLSYIAPIVDRVIRAKEQRPDERRMRAIIVYPMNALANSQLGELRKFLQARHVPRNPAANVQNRRRTSRLLVVSNTTIPQPAAGDQLLTTQQVMKLLGVCRTTLHHLVRAGELTPIRFGRRCVRFLSSDVYAFIEAHRT